MPCEVAMVFEWMLQAEGSDKSRGMSRAMEAVVMQKNSEISEDLYGTGS